MILFNRSLLVAFMAVFSFVSCSDQEGLVLVAESEAATAKGEELYRKARAADEAGKSRRAIRLYDRMATHYPFAPSAAAARYRQARILEEQGRVEDAFTAYDQYLTRFPSSNQYQEVLSRQIRMAQSAADGDVKASFLGLKTKLSLDKTVAMLEKVAGHAPRSATASKARFTIGELYEGNRRKSKEAIAAYRELVRVQPDSPEAPEALFRVGVILMDEAERGNQNQANLLLAREAFEDYLVQYPSHHRGAEARRMISALGERDLRGSFEIAEFYLKSGRAEAAKVYYRDIVKRSGPGEVHDKARARLKELGE